MQKPLVNNLPSVYNSNFCDTKKYNNMKTLHKLTLLTVGPIWIASCGGDRQATPSPTSTPIVTPTATPSPAPTATPTPEITSSPTPLPIVSPEPLPTASLPPISIPEPIPEVLVSAVMNIESFSGETLCSVDGDGFQEISVAAGIDFVHSSGPGGEIAGPDGTFGQSGGVAAGDFNNDGYIDLYAIGGQAAESALFRNNGDGTFNDVAQDFDLDIVQNLSGPSFGDMNGDGWLDLFIGGVEGAAPLLFLNSQGQSFTDIAQEANITFPETTISASWGDYDRDGNLDIAAAHWTRGVRSDWLFLMQGNGDLTFDNVDEETGIDWGNSFSRSFTPIFSDINNDGEQDLLYASDFGSSRVFLNSGDGTFEDITNPIISDENGMGAALADYDNDGDMDWFVTAINQYDHSGHPDGNRLYENRGDGYFTDVTDTAGVRHGFWGWGACFADFNNDQHLDIFQVNGMIADGTDTFEWERFDDDLSRLFMSNGDKTFTESSSQFGIVDDGQGRGVSCFDYDRDGDIDIYVANHGQAAKLYCNNLNVDNFISVRLENPFSNNYYALGAKISVTVGDTTMVREIRGGNNYASQDPAEAHFGLGDETIISELRILWPDLKTTIYQNVTHNQFLKVIRSEL